MNQQIYHLHQSLSSSQTKASEDRMEHNRHHPKSSCEHPDNEVKRVTPKIRQKKRAQIKGGKGPVLAKSPENSIRHKKVESQMPDLDTECRRLRKQNRRLRHESQRFKKKLQASDQELEGVKMENQGLKSENEWLRKQLWPDSGDVDKDHPSVYSKLDGSTYSESDATFTDQEVYITGIDRSLSPLRLSRTPKNRSLREQIDQMDIINKHETTAQSIYRSEDMKNTSSHLHMSGKRDSNNEVVVTPVSNKNFPNVLTTSTTKRDESTSILEGKEPLTLNLGWGVFKRENERPEETTEDSSHSPEDPCYRTLTCSPPRPSPVSLKRRPRVMLLPKRLSLP